MSVARATSTFQRAATSRALLCGPLTLPRTPAAARAFLRSRAQRTSYRAAGLVTSTRAAQQQHQQPFAEDGERGSFTKRITAAAATAAALAGAAAAALLASRQEDGSIPAFAAEAYSVPIGRASPEVCNCFIEVSRESRMKYEWDQETNMLKLDRVLHGAAFYPHDYGFIPQTLCGDGDPLDVLVLGTSALQPGSIVDVRPLGYMCMEDEKGLDEKVLAVPDKDPRFNHMKSLRDVPEHVLREITNFFETYKQLEKSKWVKVGGWKGTIDTHELIEQTHKTYLAGKDIEAKKHAKPTPATTVTTAAAAAAAKRKAKHAME